jgi:hypothetical protein
VSLQVGDQIPRFVGFACPRQAFVIDTQIEAKGNEFFLIKVIEQYLAQLGEDGGRHEEYWVGWRRLFSHLTNFG